MTTENAEHLDAERVERGDDGEPVPLERAMAAAQRFDKGADVGAVRDAVDAAGSMPLVDKSQLQGVAFLVHRIAATPIVGSIETGEVAYDLVSVVAQPVELAPDGEQVTRAGRLVAYHAGRVNETGKADSVHGGEVYSILIAGETTYPLLVPGGLREAKAGSGMSYWTMRPEAGQSRVDLWGDE